MLICKLYEYSSNWAGGGVGSYSLDYLSKKAIKGQRYRLSNCSHKAPLNNEIACMTALKVFACCQDFTGKLVCSEVISLIW